MTQIEKIKGEIERLKNELIQEAEKGYKSEFDEGRISAFEDMIIYINSLEEEPISNDLEKAAVEAFKQIVDSDKNSFYEIFKASAQWGMRQVEAKIQAQSMALAHGCPKEFTSNSLEEACDEYYDKTWDEHGGKAMVVDGCHDIWFPSQATDDFFKAGARWQKEQMMKNSDFINEAEWEDDIHKLFREKGKKVKLMIVEEE